jgi:pimeloyl-ACP methyl ester carboxylesterase
MKPIYKSIESERLVLESYRAFLERWPVPNQQVRVPSSQGERFVIISGPEDAFALVLLHGGVMNSLMGIREVRTFTRLFLVYCVDVIGELGLSAPARPALASNAYPAWLDDVLNHLAVAPVAILGILLGGWLALDYAIRRPEKVERVAVLCPGGIGRQKVGIVFATLLSRLPIRRRR